MLLGFDSFAALPISASGNEGNVTLSVTGNALSITIGNPGITADSVTASAIIPTLPIVMLSELPVTATDTSESGPDVANGNADIASNPKLIKFLKRRQGVCGGALPPSKDYIIV